MSPSAEFAASQVPKSLPDLEARALVVINQISALVAYWDANQKCVFSNSAYQAWRGLAGEVIVGMSMEEILGPLYAANLPYIKGALAGEVQVFERQLPRPGGGIRDSVVTYNPDIVDGVVRGFSVQIADVTRLRQRESALADSIREAIATLEKTKGSFRSKELGLLRLRLEAVLERLQGP